MRNRIKHIFTALLLLIGHLVVAESSEPATTVVTKNYEMTNGIMVALIALGVGLFAVLILFKIAMIDFFRNVRKEYIKAGKKVPSSIDLFGVFDGDIRGWSGHNQDQVMDGHEYDGIKEFDNDLPPWWKYMFYITIVFGVIYLAHYHILGTGDLQQAEYEKAAEYHAKTYPEVDPVWEIVIKDEAKLSAAKETFLGNCAACHGEHAQGLTGPNLTDQYWLYKGGVNDIFKSIKHGRSRGMKAWKAEFGNDEIHALASYVLSLQGSNPEGALEPEGEIYTGEEEKEE